MRFSDEEFLFRQDIKEKKQAGRGIYHKKCGSKSKKCTLPSDYLTRKEKQALNGEVMSYNPKKFYEWAEFKKLPMEHQINYVNSLLTRYECGLSAIGEVVFGIHAVSLHNYFKKNGQIEFVNCHGTHGSGTDIYRRGRKKLEADVAAARDSKPTEEIQNGNLESELSMEEKIKQAAETVDLYLSRGMQITPTLINEIYEEKTGMSFVMAMNYVDAPIGKVESANELGGDSKKPENSKDDLETKTFLITANKLDDSILDMIHRLFDGKDYEIMISVIALKED